MSCTILHLADLCLDYPFTSPVLPPEAASSCRAAQREALRGVIDTAMKAKVDAVTLAGNLFHAEYLHPETLIFLQDELQRLGRVPAYIAPGGGDRVSRTSPYRLWRWPSNVSVFSNSAPGKAPLSDGITLWGVAASTQAGPFGLPEDFRAEGDGIHLLLAHAPLKTESSAAKSRSAALDGRYLKSFGIHYGLLGGSAEPRFVPDDDPVLLFPGCLESVGYECNSRNGALLLRIDQQRIEVEPLPTRRQRFAVVEVGLSGGSQPDEVIRTVREQVAPNAQTVLQIRVSGRSKPSVFTAIAAQVVMLASDYLYVDLRLDARPEFDLDNLARQQSVRGAFVRRLLDTHRSAGSAQRQVIDEAIDSGLLALNNLEISCK